MKKFIPLIIVALFAMMISSASAHNRQAPSQSRWAVGIAKTHKLAHSAADRLIVSDDEIVDHRDFTCHHTHFANGSVNYADVKCPVVMVVQGGGVRDYTFHRWSTHNASGHVVIWQSFYPTPAHATGLIPPKA